MTKKFCLQLEGIITVSTIIFIIRLHFYNQQLFRIQATYDNSIEAAFATLQEPNIPIYLFIGFAITAILVYFSYKSFILADELGYIILINILVNVILLIFLILAFSNPIFTSIATVVVVIGGIAFVSSNS